MNKIHRRIAVAMQLDELEVFFAVVETGNFSAAGRKLSLSPSAVSKLMSRLEERLSVRLFHRTPRALTLTDAGTALQREGQHIFEALANAEDAVKQCSSNVSGLLRIHSLFTFAKYQLAPIMGEFLEKFPLLRVEFHLSNDPVDFMEQRIDVAIHSGSLPDSSLIARRLISSPWIICGSPDYLEKRGIPQTPADLTKHNCLNFTHRTHWNNWPLTDHEQVTTIAANGNIGANQGDMLLELARHGVGLVRLAQFHVGDDLRQKRLIPLLERYESRMQEPLFLVYQSRKYLSPKVHAFLTFLDGKFRSKE
jgi:DNA-binding transcriptional LysR family regulator